MEGFLIGKYAINVDAFKAFSQVIGLKWQEIIERNNHQDWGEELDVSVFLVRAQEKVSDSTAVPELSVRVVN